MKKILAALVFLCLLNSNAFTQNKIRPKALGVSFIFNDFLTAQRIRSGSLGKVLTDDQWAKFKEMSAGMAINYYQGLKRHIDFAATLSGSFVNYPFRNKPLSSNDGFLLEADASLNFKMVDESYWVTPFLSAGVGASKFKSSYGAFLPLGIGLKLNIFDEAALTIGGQYRVPVTYETTNYHFMYSFGISGVIGNDRK